MLVAEEEEEEGDVELCIVWGWWMGGLGGGEWVAGG